MNDEKGGRVSQDLGDREGPSRTRVVMLGSGELSRELVIALQRLGAEVIAIDRYVDAPLHGIADQSLVVNIADTAELSATIGWLQPKFVVAATDLVATDALTAAVDAGFTELVPSIRGSRLAADAEGLRRLAADGLGLPTAPFWFAGSVDELRSVAEHAGFPMVVKPVTGCLGEGRSVMVRPDDIESAWRRAISAVGPTESARVLAETVVEVDSEVTLLAVHRDSPTGSTVEFCAPIGHRSIERANGKLVVEYWQPHAMTGAALEAAKSIAARVVRSLGGRGLFGVELLVRGNEVYFDGVSVRPHDAALLTLRTQRLSAFELQARAILGLAVDTIMVSPGAARLVYSRRQAGAAPPEAKATGPETVAVVTEALNVAESDVLIFGHHEGHPRRRLGVALATASDATAARQRAEQVETALSKLWP